MSCPNARKLQKGISQQLEGVSFNGDPERKLAHIMNIRFEGITFSHADRDTFPHGNIERF